jgi:uncharacterized protein (DUF2062 family)
MNAAQPTPPRGWFARLVHDKLIEPLHHPKHEPEYTARGVLFGLLIALTPTVGIQMTIVFGVWLLVRRAVPQWDFSLVVALAWTWVTNVFTAPPLYYLYVITGRVLLGHWDDLQGYAMFSKRLAQSMPEQLGWLETAWLFIVNLLEIFGVAMFVGCLPWMVIGTWLGYIWSLRLIRRLRRIREKHALEAARKTSKQTQ